jgi:hypothetical protein
MSLATIIAENEGTMFPPATEGGIARLASRFQEELGIDLPVDYLTFLGQSDGAFVDGLMIYPSTDAASDGFQLPGALVINKSRREYHQGLRGFAVLGEVDDDLIVFRPADNIYLRIDRVSLEPFETAADLVGLIGSVVRGRHGGAQ